MMTNNGVLMQADKVVSNSFLARRGFEVKANQEGLPMKFKEYRHMKVYDQCDYQYKRIPVIMLKGKWLEELGFERGAPITVHCEDGVLTITRTDELDYDDVPHEMPMSMVAESRVKYGEL